MQRDGLTLLQTSSLSVKAASTRNIDFCKNLFLPDDASIEEREDEVEGNRTPCYEMVHPRPEMCL